LEGQALQDILSCPHLHASGILLLQELVQSYHPKNVPEIITAKTGEFGLIPSVYPPSLLIATAKDFMSYWKIYVMQMIPSQPKVLRITFFYIWLKI